MAHQNMKNTNQWLETRAGKRVRLFQAMGSDPAILQAADHLTKILRKKGRIYVFGNGGSASQASHFAAELVNRFYRDRKGLPVVALTTDTASLTAIPNDSSFDKVFSRQLEALGRRGDGALAITTSGASPNILSALDTAAQIGMFTLVLCGANTEALPPRGSGVILSVPETDTPVIQEFHLYMLHILAEHIEIQLFP